MIQQSSQFSQSISERHNNINKTKERMFGPELQHRMALTTAVLKKSEMLFPTAIIKVKSSSGTVYPLRALLDQCSDDPYIKLSVAKMLCLEALPIGPFEVTGLTDVVVINVDSNAEFQMVIEESEVINVRACVVPNLIGLLPKDEVKWTGDIFNEFKLADPTFYTPGTIDIMLGGKIYAKVLLDGVMKKCGYVAQNTQLGWIISGGEDDTEVKQPSESIVEEICV